MKLEEALKIAIEMEENVQAFYQNNASIFKSQIASKIFQTLAEEEQGHVDYLKRRQEKWLESGEIDAETLSSVIPNKDLIENQIEELIKIGDQADVESEVDVFKQAQKLELEISAFYKQLVQQLPAPDRYLFEGFLQIEECHEAILQAEISSAIGSGVWFDFMEFDQEAG